jgi:glycosyltransferase involved in cell wall biosynthesis
VGGIVDFLKPGKTGFFCESEKPETIADAVLKYEDQEVRNMIVRQAKELVVKNIILHTNKT